MPYSFTPDSTKPYITRVVGGPGDTLRVRRDSCSPAAGDVVRPQPMSIVARSFAREPAAPSRGRIFGPGVSRQEEHTMAWVSDTVFSALIIATGLLTASTLGFAVAWIRARERAIRAEQRVAQVPGGDGGRFESLEQAVETIALEVERMSEGQRFIGKLLADRTAEDREAGAQPARLVTPR